MGRLDLLLESPGALCAAAASATGAWYAAAADVALELFGVPLPVVLAALTGACGARVFLEPSSFWRALAAGAFWTATGAFTAQLALAATALWIQLPAGALAGIALLVAALGQRAGPIVWTKGGDALARRLDALWRNSKGGDS